MSCREASGRRRRMCKHSVMLPSRHVTERRRARGRTPALGLAKTADRGPALAAAAFLRGVSSVADRNGQGMVCCARQGGPAGPGASGARFERFTWG